MQSALYLLSVLLCQATPGQAVCPRPEAILPPQECRHLESIRRWAETLWRECRLPE